MAHPSHRVVAPLQPFDPDDGEVILGPERQGDGYWSGCPGVLHEPDRGRFLLTYRQRRPRGTPRERGWRCAIAESSDGVRFSDVFAVEKEQLRTDSMERSCLLPTDDGGYRLYLSYVDPADGRWRIDACEADTVDGFEVSKAEPMLTAATTGTEGVKDPYAVRVGPAVYLYASYAVDPGFSPSDQSAAHAGGDVYTTGLTTHPTGLAISTDGHRFDWRAPVLDVGDAWDRYQVRLNSVIRMRDLWLGFYDGSAGADENYEERTGLAVSSDLVSWQRLTAHGPWVTTRHASGSVRYLAAVPVGDEWWLYYEVTRSDDAHELRLSRLARP